jgi:hypothetical protein
VPLSWAHTGAVAVLVGSERRSIQLHTATPVISTTDPWLDFIDGFGFVLPKWGISFDKCGGRARRHPSQRDGEATEILITIGTVDGNPL